MLAFVDFPPRSLPLHTSSSLKNYTIFWIVFSGVPQTSDRQLIASPQFCAKHGESGHIKHAIYTRLRSAGLDFCGRGCYRVVEVKSYEMGVHYGQDGSILLFYVQNG